MNDVQKDKNLIIRLLENDIMAYKFYIDTIKNMTSEEFEEFFNGNTHHNYKVNKKSIFLLLVQKVENYKLFFNWGDDEKKYPYLEEIWKNYFCVQDLHGNKSETEIKNFLESCNINYSKWPEEIKKDFKGCINSNNDTMIYRCKEMINQLKGLPKYLLGKLKDIIDFLEKMGFTKLKNLVENFDLEILKHFLGPGISVTGFTLSTISYLKNNIIKGIGDKKLFSKETLTYFKNNKKELVSSKIFLLSETFLSLGNLVSSIQDFCEINDLLDSISSYEARFDKIQKSFYNHIKNFNYDNIYGKGTDFKKIFDSILNDINDDLNKLEILIEEINQKINECKNKKNNSTIGIISSSVGVVGSFASAIMTGGLSLVAGVHLLNCMTNTVSLGFNIQNLIQYSEIIDNLVILIEKTKKTKEDFKKIIEAIQEETKALMDMPDKLFPKYF